MNFKSVGRWWADSSIELIKIDGDVYALDGWNGEKFNNSWKCTGENLMNASREEYSITPIYDFTNEDDPEIIAYEVNRN